MQNLHTLLSTLVLAFACTSVLIVTADNGEGTGFYRVAPKGDRDFALDG